MSGSAASLYERGQRVCGREMLGSEGGRGEE